MKPTDQTILKAIKSGYSTVKEIAHRTGLSPSTVRTSARRLAERGLVQASKRTRYDNQGGYAANLFGGAGVVKRTYWWYSTKEEL